MGSRVPRRAEGVVLSLAAAATFGLLAPAAKQALDEVGPARGAGLAYLAAGGVALAALAARRLAGARASGRALAVRDLPRLSVMTLVGGVLGPVLFFFGVERVAAHRAAVVQHLEFALTVLAAVIVLAERPGRRGYAGLALVGSGLLWFSASPDVDPGAGLSWAGLLLLGAACVAWAADNTLARGASELDPLVVVSFKGIGAGTTLVVATIGGPWLLAPRTWLLLLLAGGVGVGCSLVLELLALRRIGAALNAGLFATGPAFGFVWSLLFLGERASGPAWVALALCALGAVALSVDRHEHRHVHAPLRHSHRHQHLDGHHTHAHEPGLDPATEHVHEHAHERQAHSHPHVHDDHHRHRH